MNPWDLFLNILGWLAVVALVAFVVTCVVAPVMAGIKKRKARLGKFETENGKTIFRSPTGGAR